MIEGKLQTSHIEKDCVREREPKIEGVHVRDRQREREKENVKYCERVQMCVHEWPRKSGKEYECMCGCVH